MRTPRNEIELLEREERLALAGIASGGRHLLADISQATGLAEGARRHPMITVAIATAAGAWLGPSALRLLLRVAKSPAMKRLLGFSPRASHRCRG